MRQFFMIFTAFALICLSFCAGSKKGDEFFNSGDYLRALEEYKKAAEKDPSDWNAFIKLGDCYRALKDYENAIKNYREALQVYPDWNTAKTRITGTKLEQAEFYVNENRLRQAEIVYTELSQANPENKEYIEKLAYLQKQMGNYDNSLETFQKISDRFPEDKKILDEINNIKDLTVSSRAYYTEGKQYLDDNKFEEAIEKFQKAVELKPDFKEAEYHLYISKGRLAIRRGKKNLYWQALLDLGEAMAIKPESAEPHYYMAIVYEKKDDEDYDTPISEYKKALELESESPFAEECRKKIKELSDRKEKMENFWGK